MRGPVGKRRRDDATWWFEVCEALKAWRAPLEQRLYAAVVPVAEAETLLREAIAETVRRAPAADLGRFLVKRAELRCARHAADQGRPFSPVLAVLERHWDWLQAELAAAGGDPGEQHALLTEVLQGGPLWAGEEVWGPWFLAALRERCTRARLAGREAAHRGAGLDPGRTTEHA